MPIDERQERLKALDIAVGQIEKQFGKGSIMRLGQNKAVGPVDVISTGSISIDYGLFGVPETVFISPDGTILEKSIGPVTREQVAARVEPYVPQP